MTDNPEAGDRVFTQFCRLDGSRPKEIDNAPLRWRTDGGNRPTDQYLIERGYYGLVRAEPPVHNEDTHKAVRKPMGEWVVDFTARTVTETWEIVTLDAEGSTRVREEKRAAVRAEGERRVGRSFGFEGVAYQMEEKSDWDRLARYSTLALGAVLVDGSAQDDLKWAGATDFKWRAADDTMTPMDAMTLFRFSQAATLWERLHYLAARKLIRTSGGIPADYTKAVHWPNGATFND